MTETAVPRVDFGALNYAILVLYLVAMVAIGWWARGRAKSTSGFFVGEGKLHYVLVGLSLLATYLSALTMMALPRVSFGQDDFIWTVQLPCLIITALVITRFVLPRLREANVVSVYEFLEQRIHVSVRLITSAAFLVLSVGRMALNLFLPALALHTILGFDLPTTIVVIAVVVIAFSYIGGIVAVIWTDAIMAVIFTLGAIVSVVSILSGIGLERFADIASEHHKFRTFVWDLDWTKKATLWFVLETIFQTIRIYGTQQDMTQRYMATESTAKANRSVWLAILGYIPLGFLFYFLGTALFVFYQAHPDPVVPTLMARKGYADAVYPWFIVTQLPTGLSGFMVVAIFAASMSTLSSSLNSGATVMVEDFYKRLFRRDRSDRHYLMVARVLTAFFGALAIAAGLALIGRVEQAQDTWNKVMGVSTCGVLGLMALAILPFRVNTWAALTGFLCACACLLYVTTQTKIIFLLWPVITSTVCFGVALALHALLPSEPSAAKAAPASGAPK
ncbi:MAG: sodium/solute symporter [Planctomycetes bacterium]|nr:sodium/solute symporter [Planctomycetota bacterium]